MPPRGITEIAATFGKTRVSVKLTTHVVDVGKPSDPYPEKILTSCTYSRIPCSLLDYIEISVNGNIIHVPRSAYAADVADVALASLRQKKKGLFVLELNGGDAAGGYAAEIAFDKDRVIQRTLEHGKAGQIMQKTTYFVLKWMD